MRRTPPRGWPTQTWDDDVTQPGMDAHELAEMRQRRSRKVSQAYEWAKDATTIGEDLKRRIAALETGYEQVKEVQIRLAHITDQLAAELKKRSELEKDAARVATTESGAWRRQVVASVIATCALAVSVIAAFSRC